MFGKSWDVIKGVAEVTVPGGRIATKGLEGLKNATDLQKSLDEQNKLPPDKQRLASNKALVTLRGVCEEQQDQVDALVKRVADLEAMVALPCWAR